MSMRNKCSHEQLKKATQARADLKGGTVTLSVLDDEEEETLQSWPWEETREPTWFDTCESAIRDYAEAQGPGAYKYAVRTLDKKGTQRASTWCRWVIKRERGGTADTGDELDGSVQAFMVHLQRAYEDERRARMEAQKMLSEQAAASMKLLHAMTERQMDLEREHRATRDKEREQLAIATKALEEAASKEGSDDDGSFGALIGKMGEHLAGKAVERFAPQLEPLVEVLVKEFVGDAKEAAAAAVDGAAPKELHS